jgi:hypothetical protein
MIIFSYPNFYLSHSTRLLAATTLRNVLGTKNLAEILSEREKISENMQNSLDEATDPWGVKVERVEIKDVRLPVQLQRAMAAEAEAAREARAKVSSTILEQPKCLEIAFLFSGYCCRRRTESLWCSEGCSRCHITVSQCIAGKYAAVKL